MTILHIALQEGFHDHSVTIAVDGHKAYNKQGVTTDIRISRADEVDVDVAAPHAQLTVSVEPGHVQQSFDVDTAKNPYVAIQLQPSGKIVFTPSNERFRYM